MNERIKELAQQALDIVSPNRDLTVALSEFELKFAALIIKECARVDSDANNPDHVDGETYNQTILQHFGVKE